MKNRMFVSIVIIALICLSSCVREYLAEKEEDNSIGIPEQKELSVDEIVKQVENCLDNFNFDIAREYLEFLKEEENKQELSRRIKETEKFADNYLLYFILENGEKVYVRNNELESKYKNNKNINLSEIKTLYLKEVPETATALFNLEKYFMVKYFAYGYKSPGGLQFLNLKVLPDLYSCHISDISNPLTVDLRGSEKLGQLSVADCSQTKILMSKPKQEMGYIRLKDSSFDNFDSFDLSMNQELDLWNVYLKENWIVGSEMTFLDRLNINYGLGIGESDWSIPVGYNVILLNHDFLHSLGKKAPNLTDLQYFMSSGKFPCFEASEMNFPNLKSLSLQIDKKDESEVGEELVDFNFFGCRNLSDLKLSGCYATEVDFSKMSSTTNSNLKSIMIKGGAIRVKLPDITGLQMTIDLSGLEEIIVPENAKQKISISLLNSSNSGKEVSDFSFVNFSAINLEKLINEVESLSLYNLFFIPSNIKPLSHKVSIMFDSEVLDFSGDQWIGFKGNVIIKSPNVHYLDFGNLHADNVLNKEVRVANGCVIKNKPEIVSVKHIARY